MLFYTAFKNPASLVIMKQTQAKKINQLEYEFLRTCSQKTSAREVTRM